MQQHESLVSLRAAAAQLTLGEPVKVGDIYLVIGQHHPAPNTNGHRHLFTSVLTTFTPLNTIPFIFPFTTTFLNFSYHSSLIFSTNLLCQIRSSFQHSLKKKHRSQKGRFHRLVLTPGTRFSFIIQHRISR